MTTNDIETVDQAIGKRVYYESVSITQSNLEATAKRRGMYEIRKQITNAFYCEYLRRMIPKVQLMQKKITTLSGNTAAVYEPDLFRLSSETILEIFKDTQVQNPDYIYRVSYEDYFEVNAITEQAKDLIVREWLHNRSAFHVLKKQNRL